MISDFAARAAAIDPSRSFIVQAPAGSGKTGLLVYRMLRLLSTVDQPQQVLAITFTRKATSEMRERMLQLLRLAESKQTSDDVFEQQGIDLAKNVLVRDQARQWSLLNSPHQLQILTIDAYCAKLTASMPWLSRLGDRPRTTDQADVHYAAAVEQLLAELLDEESAISPALQTVMLELDFNYNKARQLFTSMLAKRDQWLRHLLSNDLVNLREQLEDTWSEIVEYQTTALGEQIGSATIIELSRLAKYAAIVLYEKDPDKPSILFSFLQYDESLRQLNLEQYKALVFLLIAPSTGKFRKSVNIGLGFAPKTEEKDQLSNLLKELCDDDALTETLNATSNLPSVEYQDQDWQQLLALETVLKSLAAFLQLRFRAVGECDHSEVTQRANLALQELDNPTDLGLRMDAALQHILVDEFQDTSTGQIELLKKLTEAWSSAEDSVARTLFLVGDPMQSIYRFREADVSLFLQVADNQNTQVFCNLDIETLALSENFRSSSTLVSWFNQTFDDSFPCKNDVLTGAIRYSAATSSRASDQHCVDFHLANSKAHEAQLLVDAVQNALSELNNESSKIAILVRSRAQLDYLLPSLSAAQIDYVGVDIQPLAAQQAVIDVIALCKAICREDDKLSWLALLRGPWCGLSLAEIKKLLAAPSKTVWQQLENCNLSNFEEASRLRLERFVRLMREAKQQSQQVDLGALTRWAWTRLGGEQTLFGVNPGDIEIVFELIENLQRGGDLSSMNDLDRALASLYARPTQTAAQNAKVVVSTMHKSKGLQYDTVILPGLANPGRAEDKSILMWAEQQNQHGQANLLLAPLRLDPEQDDHYSYLRKLDSDRARNELIRLMYVATTRAERKLVMIARIKIDDETQELKKPVRTCLLATVWESVQTEFTYSPTDDLAGIDEQELSQTLHRLPAGYAPTMRASIEWQVEAQVSTTDNLETENEQNVGPNSELEFEWATEVATGVGIVLHEWLQHNSAAIKELKIDDSLRRRWRRELLALGVPALRLEVGVKRLIKAIENIQSDQTAEFIFKNYQIQQNEYAIASYEDGAVQQYRIDRTFVDKQDVRWIVDYKSTDTRSQDIDAFVDEQVAHRHKEQLQKYGDLMSQIDEREIKLAVYFPLLKTLRVWNYKDSN